MRRNSIFTKRWVKGSAVLVATAATLVFANPQQAIATPLKGVDSATVSQSASNVVDIDFADGIKGRITFLEDGIFRYNVDPKGEFSDYATPRSKSHTAKIQAQPDTSDTYSKPSATVADKGDTIEITGGKATVILDKATGKMSIKSGDRVVVSESASSTLIRRVPSRRSPRRSPRTSLAAAPRTDASCTPTRPSPSPTRTTGPMAALPRPTRFIDE